MTVSYHAIYWGAYVCIALLTLVIFFVAVILSKTLGRSCDPLRHRNYAQVPEEKPTASTTHEEIALQEKPPQLPPPSNEGKV